MLSRIIERNSTHTATEDFFLERIHRSAQPVHPSTDSPDVLGLNRRIQQLEQALAETEANAYARGRREAEAEANQRYSSAMQATADRLAQSVKQLADVRPRLAKEAETDLLRLAMAIAQRILHRQLTIDATALESLVRTSLDKLGRQEQIRVRVHSALADAIRSILSQICSQPVEVAADSKLAAGSIIFETNRGLLDASIHSQLDEIERGLIDRLDNRPERP